MKNHDYPLSKRSQQPRSGRLLTAFACSAVLLLGACAQQSEPGYYEQSRASTATDARHRAQGNGSIAPSQLQIGFGQTQAVETENSPVAHKNIPANLSDTRTYLGTFECSAASDCKVQRMTLTIAPDGQWRARNTAVAGSLNQLDMGCWVITNNNPIRLNLNSENHTFATVEFSQVNVLRLVRINNQKPLLQSHLTRQADIDPIQELADTPALNCN